MNKKNRFKAGLRFGVLMSAFYILQSLITNEGQTTNEIIFSIIGGILGGAIAGLLFGWIIGLFAGSKFVSQTTRIDLEPGETVLFETAANHFKGIEAVGGKLYLTNKRLVYKSHKLNIQNHQLSIALNDIKNVERSKTMGLVNNGLLITTISGAKERFVVDQAEDWVQHLIGTMDFQKEMSAISSE